MEVAGRVRAGGSLGWGGDRGRHPGERPRGCAWTPENVAKAAPTGVILLHSG